MDFAYWWSCIGKGLRLQPAQQACFYMASMFLSGTSDSYNHPCHTWPILPLAQLNTLSRLVFAGTGSCNDWSSGQGGVEWVVALWNQSILLVIYFSRATVITHLLKIVDCPTKAKSSRCTFFNVYVEYAYIFYRKTLVGRGRVCPSLQKVLKLSQLTFWGQQIPPKMFEFQLQQIAIKVYFYLTYNSQLCIHQQLNK